MDNNASEKVSKEIQRIFKEASEEVRGREFTPTQVDVTIRIKTKENYTIKRELNSPVESDKK